MIKFLSVISLLSVQLVYSEECDVSVRPQREVEANWKSNVPEEWRGLVDCKLKIYKKNGASGEWHSISGGQRTKSEIQLSVLATRKSQIIRSLRVVGKEDCQIAIRINEKCSGGRKGPQRSIVIKAGSICELKDLFERPHCFGKVWILHNATWNSENPFSSAHDNVTTTSSPMVTPQKRAKTTPSPKFTPQKRPITSRTSAISSAPIFLILFMIACTRMTQ